MLLLLLAVPAFAQGQTDLSTGTLPDKRAYQVLAPAQAKTEANLPLVLYLSSPAGPNLDAFQKDWWPGLKDRKCVVAVPTSRSPKMWLTEEGNYVEAVLADVQKTYTTDPKRIILLGVSGGGQMALFFADHAPGMFRAVVAVSTNPVVIRKDKSEWFYPSEKVLKTCPYFVVNHITEGSSLLYWRQVREKLGPRGASISILPVLGDANSHYLPPPKELWPWLDEVLAGRQPAPLADPQKAAVARMFEKPAAALVTELERAQPSPSTQSVLKEAAKLSLSVPVPAEFERSKQEEVADSAKRPMVMIRLEHAKDAVYIRCEARSAEKPMKDILGEEANQTILRGRLYQIYATGRLAGDAAGASGGGWEYQIGSITFPHKDRGWQSTLFLHAWSPTSADGKQWLEVTVLDETQQPDASQLARAAKTVVGGVKVTPAQPKTAPAK